MTRILPADNAGGQNSFRFFTRFRTHGMTQTLPADNAGGQNSFRFFITRFWTYGMTQAMPADNAGSRESFRFFYYPVLGLRNDSGYAGGQCRRSGIIPFFITLFWACGMTQAMPADKTGGP